MEKKGSDVEAAAAAAKRLVDKGLIGNAQELEAPSFAPGAMARIMSGVTTTGSSGEVPKELRRRGCAITIFPQQCRPGALAEQIRVGLEELEPPEELAAFKEAGGIAITIDDESDEAPKEINVSYQALMSAFARRAIRTVNGERISSDEREVLWSLLDMHGRTTLGTAYMSACTGGKEASGFLGRSMASLEVY